MNEILWVTGQPWAAIAGIDVDEHGFINVYDTLLTPIPMSSAGDIAVFLIPGPRPACSCASGKALTNNLRRALLTNLAGLQSVEDMLAPISAGDKYAVAAKAGIVAEGAWLWTLKDGLIGGHG